MENTCEATLFCQAITVKGKKCKSFSIKNSTFCDCHNPSNKCQGTKRDGTKCLGRKRIDSDYCCDDHNPLIERSTDPLDFRQINLRQEMIGKVLWKRNHVDPYSNNVIKAWEKPISGYHLDHVFEINLAREVYDGLRHVKAISADELDNLKRTIKITVNQEFNLALTEEKINLGKTAAMQNFALDYRKDTVNNDGIKHYFRQSAQTRLTRGNVSNICKEITISVDSISDHIAEINEDEKTTDLYLNGLEDIMESLKIRL